MDMKEFAQRGAAATNKILTTEGRRKAAKKGWRERKRKLNGVKTGKFPNWPNSKV